MSPAPPSSPVDRETGPGRFQRVDAAPERRPVGAALGAAALLLLLVVGVPLGLLWLGGVPDVPTSLPTREQLTGAIGTEQLLAVLVWVVWLAWLQFTVCVLVELRSAVSGIGLPARVPLAGPSQRFARTLVVTVLLLTTAAGQASAAVGTLAPERVAGTSVSVSVAAGTGVAAEAGAVAPTTGTAAGVQAPAPQDAVQGETSYWLGDVQLSPEEGAQLVGQRVYVVQPPEGRYHDNLWDIAERTLGEGRRYQEVFGLNKDRPQPDGQELTLERLIHPGWLLVMPEDAAAVERVTAVFTPSAPPEAPPVSEVPGFAPEGAVVEDAAPAQGDAVVADGSTAEAPGVVGPAGLVGAGLLAAGLVAAVDRLRRRRPTGEPSDDAVDVEVALRVGADPRRALLLDHGLRQLARAVRAAGSDLPGVFSVLVDDTSVELRLAPAAPTAPAPWRVLDAGRAWRWEASDAGLPPGDGPAPFPGLVSLGRDAAGRDVLVDLEAAQGPVAIVGDATVARELATALVCELGTNRWSGDLRVTGVDLPAALGALPAERYAAAPTLGPLLERLGGRRADVLGASVLTGRARGGTGAWVPEYVVLGAVPPEQTARQLAALTATDQRSPLGVVCVGDLPGSRWQLVAEPDGRLTAPLLGIDVRANRFSARQLAALSELLAPAPEPVRAVDEQRMAAEHEGAVDRPAVDAPPRPLGVDDLDAAAVRVRVLGEPRVEAPGPLEESRRALATELVTYLALHPGGTHVNVLAAALWPRGVTPEVRDAAVARTAAWLGADASGRPHLLRDAGGRLVLGDGVVVDWDVVRSLLARSRGAADPRAERADLTAALRITRGPVLSARPAGRYSWLARARLERSSRALLVDAVHRLVVLCRDDGDPVVAQAVAWAGLQLVPTEELLWRDLLRAAHAVGGEAGVTDVARLLDASLRAAGVAAPSPATHALVEDLAPDAGTSAPSTA